MWISAKLGLRNLLRQRRRTILTTLMMTAGTVLLVYMAGLAEGSYADMIELATGSYTGHFQVLGKGYHEKPSMFVTVNDPKQWEQKLEAHPHVTAATSRVEAPGLLSHENRTTGILLMGVNPGKEHRVASYTTSMAKGEWLPDDVSPDDDLPIVIGTGLAKRLKVGMGDELSFISQAADGSIAAELYRVHGLIDTGVDEIDAQVGFVRLQDAQELLVLGDRVHRVLALTDKATRAAKLAADFTPEDGQEILTWAQLMPELSRGIEVDKGGQHIFLVIVLIVIALGVTNTMMMSVLERTREFGVLLAIGTTPGMIVRTTIWEAAWMSVVGVGLGVTAGSILNLYVGLPMDWFGGPMEVAGVVLSKMDPVNNLRGNIVYPSLITCAGVLASFIPARRASKLVPSTALRQT